MHAHIAQLRGDRPLVSGLELLQQCLHTAYFFAKTKVVAAATTLHTLCNVLAASMNASTRMLRRTCCWICSSVMLFHIPQHCATADLPREELNSNTSQYVDPPHRRQLNTSFWVRVTESPAGIQFLVLAAASYSSHIAAGLPSTHAPATSCRL